MDRGRALPSETNFISKTKLIFWYLLFAAAQAVEMRTDDTHNSGRVVIEAFHRAGHFFQSHRPNAVASILLPDPGVRLTSRLFA
jgi:hypothetical protein